MLSLLQFCANKMQDNAKWQRFELTHDERRILEVKR